MRIPQEIYLKAESFIQDFAVFFKRLARTINGGLTFGDGVSIDNIAGKWISFNTGDTPGEEIELSHNLGVIPCGFLLVMPPQDGTINPTSTPWTTEKMYLSGTELDQDVRIFVLIPPLSP